MNGWYERLLKWLRSEAGMVLIPGFRPDRDEDSAPGANELGAVDEGEQVTDPRDIEPGEGDESEPGDEGGEEEPVKLTDDQVVEFLKSKGLKVNNLDDIGKTMDQYGSLTTKHQTAIDAQKALRAVLGDDYDRALAQGMRKLATGENGLEDMGGDIPEPPHFSLMKPETRKQVADTFDYHFRRVLPGMTQDIIKGVLRAIDDRDNQREENSFAESNEEYDTYKDAIQQYRDKHGITGRGKDTLAWLLKTVKQEAGEAVKDLAGNELGTKRKLGTPPPKSQQRGGKGKSELKTDADFERELERRRAAAAKG
jgi:hypothetical protein